MKKKAEKATATAHLAEARRDIAKAEADLGKLVAAIKALPRAEKVTASTVVHEAFDKLRSANARLDELQRLLDAKA